MNQNLMATLSKEGTISKKSGAGRSATVPSRLAVRRENIAHGHARESDLGARRGSGEGVGHVTVTEKTGKGKNPEKEVVQDHVSARIGVPGTTLQYTIFALTRSVPSSLVSYARVNKDDPDYDREAQREYDHQNHKSRRRWFVVSVCMHVCIWMCVFVCVHVCVFV